MPIYAYKCAACGHSKDVLQKLSDAPLSECPACGAASFSKQVTAAGFQLKGSGWYATDFRGGNNQPGAGDAKDGDAKTEAKPADATTTATKSDSTAGGGEKSGSDKSAADKSSAKSWGSSGKSDSAGKSEKAPAASTGAGSPRP